jgi:Protein of unknown function (DUF2281)
MVAQPATSPSPSDPVSAARIATGQILTTLQQLPQAQQQQVLDFVEFLAQKGAVEPAPKSIWEKIDDRLSGMPDAVWETVPTDGSYQHDHYLYGTPKQT